MSAGARPAGETAYQWLRLEAGVPEGGADDQGPIGRELTEDYIPLEANLWPAVSFTKGCYIGQEIIARMESRGKLARRLVGLRLEAPAEVGAEVRPVDSGSRTLKDAINEAMRDWTTNVRTTHYLLGSVLGAHPYPMMVRDFQSVIGEESIAQMQEMAGRQPDAVIACVGGGSNAMGIFYPYISHASVRANWPAAVDTGPPGRPCAQPRSAPPPRWGAPGPSTPTPRWPPRSGWPGRCRRP